MISIVRKMNEIVNRILKENQKSALIAGFFYVSCQILIRGFGFITTPVFSRVLSKADYGIYSNFLAWEGILLPILTLNLQQAIGKSKYDFREQNDNFLASILIFADFLILQEVVIVLLFREEFESLFNMPFFMIGIMLIYLFFHTAFNFQQTKYNLYGKYKTYVAYSIASAMLNLGLSLILVYFLPDKLFGRMMGILIPMAVIGCYIYWDIFKRGPKLSWKYIRYALKISVPLMVFPISWNLLSVSDRVMIARFAGLEQTALYSVAYSISAIATVIVSGLSQAWYPWLLDNLDIGNSEGIRKRSGQFALIYCALIILLMMVSPEIIIVMGGGKYYEARFVMPPIILAMVFQFFADFYINAEYYYGETYIISLGTLIAAIANIVLNIIFIPLYGYVAAAYTTLIGHAVLFFYHLSILQYKLKKTDLYSSMNIIVAICFLCFLQIGIAKIYDLMIIRYILVLMYLIFGVSVFKRWGIDWKI